MTKEIWLNLPVKNVERTKKFFSQIGFALNEKLTNEEIVCFEIGEKKMTAMFIVEETFVKFTDCEISDTKNGSEILISFDAESREAVDETASRVFEAGGTIFRAPEEIQDWMYGFGFVDLDGHRWNPIFMDFAKMPAAPLKSDDLI